MKEIFTSHSFKEALKKIPIDAHQTFYKKSVEYEIWLLSDEAFMILDSYKDDTQSNVLYPKKWEKEWGWWRWYNGSNIEGSPTHTFLINNKEVELYYSKEDVLNFFNELFQDSVLFTVPDELKEIQPEKLKIYFDEYGTATDIFDYIKKIWNCSMMDNVCPILVANAKLNKLTLGDFLTDYT